MPTVLAVEYLLRKFAKISTLHSKHDLTELTQLTEVLKGWLRERASNLARDTGDQPLLSSYQGDGTPLLVRHTLKGTQKRSGKTGREYYVHCQFLAAMSSSGAREQTVTLEEPRPCTQGKTSVALLSFALQMLLDVRKSGHTGPFIFHTGFDRAMNDALNRLLEQYFTLRAAKGTDEGEDALWEYLLAWHINTPCAAHDVHNALKWALYFMNTSEEVQKEIYVALESCRHSYKQLADARAQWLATNLRRKPRDELPSRATLAALWEALGADAKTVKEIQDLGFSLQDDEPCVADDVPMDTLLTRVKDLMLDLWKLRSFSWGRWVGGGEPCRKLMGSILSGLGGVVKQVIVSEDESNYYINGFTRLGDDAKALYCVEGLASYPSEQVLRAILKDNRLAQRGKELEEIAAATMDWLSTLPSTVWETLASVSGLETETYKSMVIHAAHVSVSFMSWRVFSALKEYPWRLMQGNLDEQLDKLLAGAQPQETVAGKLYKLLKSNLADRELIKAALRLASEAPWTTQVPEQLHASGAVALKFHPDVCEPALVVRAFTHAARHLLPETSKKARLADRLRKRLTKLKNKNPAKAGARQMMCKDLVRQTSQWKAKNREGVEKTVQKRVFQTHGSVWAGLPAQKRQRFANEAAIHQFRSIDALPAAIATLQDEVGAAQEAVETELNRTGSLNLGSCKLSDDDLLALQDAFDHPQWTQDYVGELRSAALEAPDLLPPTAVAELEKVPFYKQQINVQRPWWLHKMAYHRDAFASTALEFNCPDAKQYFKYMFAQMGNKLHVAMSRLQPVDIYHVMHTVTSDNWEGVAMEYRAFEFEADWLSDVPWYKLPRVPPQEMRVITDLVHEGGRKITTRDTGTPFLQFMGSLVDVPPARMGEEKHDDHPHKRKLNWRAQILAKYPWLEGAIEEDEKEEKRKRLKAKTAVQKDGDLGELDDDQIEEMFDLLRKQRAELAEGGKRGQCTDFKWRVLGCKKKMQEKGQASDAVAGIATPNSPASDFSDAYGLGRFRRFEINLYHMEGASCLAQEWCRKAQHYWNIYSGQKDANYIFSEADHTAFLFGAAFRHMLEVCEGAALRRVQWLRDLRARQ